MALTALRSLLWPRPSEEHNEGCVQSFRRYLRSFTMASGRDPGPALVQLRGLRTELDTLIGYLEQEEADRRAEPETRRRLLVKCEAAIQGKDTPCA